MRVIKSIEELRTNPKVIDVMERENVILVLVKDPNNVGLNINLSESTAKPIKFVSPING